MEKKYSMETGLASDLQPVIKCSPEMYDRLIDEAKALFDELILTGPAGEKKKRIAKYSKKYPALGLLCHQPRMRDIVKSN